MKKYIILIFSAFVIGSTGCTGSGGGETSDKQKPNDPKPEELIYDIGLSEVIFYNSNNEEVPFYRFLPNETIKVSFYPKSTTNKPIKGKTYRLVFDPNQGEEIIVQDDGNGIYSHTFTLSSELGAYPIDFFEGTEYRQSAYYSVSLCGLNETGDSRDISYNEFTGKLICSYDQFSKIKDDPSGNYMIGDSLYLSQYQLNEEGELETLPRIEIPEFSGKIQGNNFYLYNFDAEDLTSLNVGLFQVLTAGAEIRNLNIIDFSVLGNSKSNTGMLAGEIIGNSSNPVIIDNVNIFSEESNLFGLNVGAFAGKASYAKILNSSYSINLRMNSLDPILNLGGAIAVLENSEIQKMNASFKFSDDWSDSPFPVDKIMNKLGGLVGSSTNSEINEIELIAEMNLSDSNMAGCLAGSLFGTTIGDKGFSNVSCDVSTATMSAIEDISGLASEVIQSTIKNSSFSLRTNGAVNSNSVNSISNLAEESVFENISSFGYVESIEDASAAFGKINESIFIRMNLQNSAKGKNVTGFTFQSEGENSVSRSYFYNTLNSENAYGIGRSGSGTFNLSDSVVSNFMSGTELNYGIGSLGDLSIQRVLIQGNIGNSSSKESYGISEEILDNLTIGGVVVMADIKGYLNKGSFFKEDNRSNKVEIPNLLGIDLSEDEKLLVPEENQIKSAEAGFYCGDDPNCTLDLLKMTVLLDTNYAPLLKSAKSTCVPIPPTPPETESTECEWVNSEIHPIWNVFGVDIYDEEDTSQVWIMYMGSPGYPILRY